MTTDPMGYDAELGYTDRPPYVPALSPLPLPTLVGSPQPTPADGPPDTPDTGDPQ